MLYSEDLRGGRLGVFSEDLRGGKLGGCFESLRGGGRGGSAGDIFGVSGFAGAGWFPKYLADVGALLKIGGLFTVCCLC